MICLDFDGVIADSYDMWHGIFRTTASFFEITLPPNYRPFRTLRPLTFEMLGRSLGADPSAFAETMANLAMTEECVVPIISGMEQVLSALSDIAPLTIVSSSRKTIIHRFVTEHKIESFFNDIIGGGDGRSKGDILQGYVGEGARMMIGDAASDIDAAKMAGLIAIGVTWGWQDAEMLRHADFVVSSPEELFETVKRVGILSG